MTKLLLIIFSLFLQGCAVLHHAQIGNIDNSKGYVRKPIDIKLSETGVNFQEIKGTSQALLSKSDNENVQNVLGFVALFQMGPRTGNPVFVKDYAKNLIQVIYEKCPTGRVTGLTSIRETRKYPVVSGEIAKVTGYCLLPKEG